MRYFIEIAYNGKNYFGWQRQPKQISVQQVLEETMSILLRSEIKLIGAGRTDTGVHAKQLFAHFDFKEIENKAELVFRLNSFLPDDISINNIFNVDENAHARFNAIEREYEYVISLKKDPFLQDFSFQINKLPDFELMNQAANLLMKYTDFQCFSRSNTDVKTYNCVVTKAVWKLIDNKLVFTIVADRFLRNMVRAIVGTLLVIGYGKTNLQEFESILKGKNRAAAGASAPAHGLFLVKINYPKDVGLTNREK